MANPLTKEYIAGYMDGEGCIALYERKKGRGFKPQVLVTNTYRPIVAQLRQTYGGSLYSKQRPKPRKLVHKWAVGRKAAIQQFLQDILPFLNEKQPQAMILLQFLNGEIPGEFACAELRRLKHCSSEAED